MQFEIDRLKGQFASSESAERNHARSSGSILERDKAKTLYNDTTSHLKGYMAIRVTT
jgi:hypothetical protein